MKYEMFAWLNPDLASDQFKKEVKELKELIPSSQIEELGKRKLAYAIKGLVHGYELQIKFEADPKIMKDLAVSLNHRANVVRYLLTKSL